MCAKGCREPEPMVGNCSAIPDAPITSEAELLYSSIQALWVVGSRTLWLR